MWIGCITFVNLKMTTAILKKKSWLLIDLFHRQLNIQEERSELKIFCIKIGSIKYEAFQNYHMTYRNAFLLDYHFPWCLSELDLAVFHQVLEMSDLVFFSPPSPSLGQATVRDVLRHIWCATHPPSCCPEAASSTGCCGMERSWQTSWSQSLVCDSTNVVPQFRKEFLWPTKALSHTRK